MDLTHSFTLSGTRKLRVITFICFVGGRELLKRNSCLYTIALMKVRFKQSNWIIPNVLADYFSGLSFKVSVDLCFIFSYQDLIRFLEKWTFKNSFIEFLIVSIDMFFISLNPVECDCSKLLNVSFLKINKT